jgi:hypothetical protein
MRNIKRQNKDKQGSRKLNRVGIKYINLLTWQNKNKHNQKQQWH